MINTSIKSFFKQHVKNASFDKIFFHLQKPYCVENKRNTKIKKQQVSTRLEQFQPFTSMGNLIQIMNTIKQIDKYNENNNINTFVGDDDGGDNGAINPFGQFPTH